MSGTAPEQEQERENPKRDFGFDIFKVKVKFEQQGNAPGEVSWGEIPRRLNSALKRVVVNLAELPARQLEYVNGFLDTPREDREEQDYIASQQTDLCRDAADEALAKQEDQASLAEVAESSADREARLNASLERLQEFAINLTNRGLRVTFEQSGDQDWKIIVVREEDAEEARPILGDELDLLMQDWPEES